MSHRPTLARREFLLAAGGAWLAGLAPAAAEWLDRTEAVFAASLRTDDGRYALATVTVDGAIIETSPLPDRAHGVTVCPATGRAVFFARRPGTFALAYDPRGRQRPVSFATPAGRHFYGHGAFSADGRLLYATENDFDAARGVIGVYDASNGFARLAEFDSGGTGPHEVIATADGKRLFVANGGIETHPDFGRAKLNLATMRPSIAILDAENGTLIERHDLPAEYHRLSVRHIAEDGTGGVWFGGQYEGSQTERPPLVGCIARGEPLAFCHTPEPVLARLSNYVGAVAINRAENLLAVTSPRGNAAALFDTRTAKLVRLIDMPGVCATAPAPHGLAFSNDAGRFAETTTPGVAWDQHMALLRSSA